MNSCKIDNKPQRFVGMDPKYIGKYVICGMYGTHASFHTWSQHYGVFDTEKEADDAKEHKWQDVIRVEEDYPRKDLKNEVVGPSIQVQAFWDSLEILNKHNGVQAVYDAYEAACKSMFDLARILKKECEKWRWL